MGTLRRRKGREVWTALYRDGDGIRREVSTGCKSKDAAKQVLASLERHAEKVRAGIVSRQEAKSVEWARVPLTDHVEAHAAYMKGLGRAPRTVQDQERLMLAVADGCGWKRLSDLNRSRLEQWLTVKVSEGMGARTRNAYAVASVAFGNWMVRAGRLTVNPFAGVPMMNVKADRRHERRVLTMAEFARLLEATVRRPLQAASVNRGRKAKLTAATVDKLEWIGKTRSMIYATLMFTGLRYGELKSITIGQVHLDAAVPHIELRAASDKARRGAQVPLPASFAALLGKYVAERRSHLLGQRGASAAFPGVLDTAPLFEMPGNMIHAFDADLSAAGIAKMEAQGRVLDIHALRHSFCTMVAQSGVSMQHAQRLMRHATPAMTARYTHLTLTDLGGAIAALSGLPEIAQPAVAAAAETTSNLRPLLRPQFGCISSGHRALSCTTDPMETDVVDVAENGKDPSNSVAFREFEDGERGGTRTRGHRIKSPMLYQPELPVQGK